MCDPRDSLLKIKKIPMTNTCMRTIAHSRPPYGYAVYIS